MKKKVSKKSPEVSMDDPYLCGACAKRLGGTWPDGHCATMHSGICPYCNKKKGLCCIGDYDWPDKNFIDLRD